MDTEIIQKPKKKFAIGAIFAFLSAITMAGFCLWEIIESGITAVTLFAESLTAFLGSASLGNKIAASVALANATANLSTCIGNVISLLSAVALIALGVLLLLKVNSRIVGFLFAVPAAVLILSFALSVVVAIVNFIIYASVSMAGSSLAMSALSLSMSVITVGAWTICWGAAFAFVFVFGGGKEYQKPKALMATLLGVAVGLLFAVATIVSIVVSQLMSGMVLWTYIQGMLMNGIVIDFAYILKTFGSAVYAVAKNVSYGVLFAVTGFFSVKWLISPYKKA